MTALLALLLTGTAHANDRAKELFQNGKELYNQGRYESAIVAWKEAYELDPRPVLLFNLANAYERSGLIREALEALEGYRPLARAEEGEALDARIRSMQDRVREMDEEERKAEAERLAAERLLEEERRKAEAARLEAEAAKNRRGPPVLPIAITAVGAGLVGFGVVEGLGAVSARKTLKDPAVCAPGGPCLDTAADAFARQKRAALLADVGLVSGIAVTGLGAFLLVSRPKASDHVVLPTVDLTGGHASLGVTGAF